MISECGNILNRYLNIKENDWEAEVVTKKYAFEISDIPPECDYLKVQYSYQIQKKLPIKLNSEVFKLALQTTQPAIEQLLI